MLPRIIGAVRYEVDCLECDERVSVGTSGSEDQVKNSHDNQQADQQENPDHPGKHFQHEDSSHMSNAQ